jgi:hypothetical protein
MSSSRDLIQISLGSSSNAITAHLLNLQGLAGTNGNDGDADHDECDASTTHRFERNFLVPRCLMVDEPTRFYASAEISQGTTLLPLTAGATSFSSTPFVLEPLDPTLTLSHATPNAWSRDYQAKAATLAYSQFSRFYQELPKQGSAPSTYRSSSENSRHVNWDEEGEEEEDTSETDDWQQRQARKQQELSKWRRETLQPLQSDLLQRATTVMEKNSLLPEGQEELSWMDFWMPPYSEKSKIALEHSHQSTLAPHWDAYCQLSGGAQQHWMEENLFEGLRHLLEESDSCQGFVLTTEGYSLYAGMATAVLEELQQESKSSGRMVFHVTNPSSANFAASQLENTENEPWQPAHVQRVRRHISSGLALHDLTQNAHVVVPVELDESLPLFQASAKIAMALEACTLPIRLAARSPRRIGLTNAPFVGQGGEYDMHWGSTAQHLSMGEYLQCLSPSSQYKVLELDALHSAKVDQDQLWRAMMVGTSLERDARTRDNTGNARYGPRDAPPGGWLQNFTGTSSGHAGQGLLTCLSPSPHSDPRFADRSLHHHFALATAIRPIQLESDSDPRYQYDPTAKTLGHYLTATVQGMGIAYRPERSMSVIGSQTLGQLTFSNPSSGGAGAYWRSLLATVEQPTLAVLGNSTRVYGYLNQVSTDMKMVLGSRYRGYHQRDIVNEVLPEEADCQEALEGCFDLRDIYHPPDGSGLANATDLDLDY